MFFCIENCEPPQVSGILYDAVYYAGFPEKFHWIESRLNYASKAASVVASAKKKAKFSSLVGQTVYAPASLWKMPLSEAEYEGVVTREIAGDRCEVLFQDGSKFTIQVDQLIVKY